MKNATCLAIASLLALALPVAAQQIVVQPLEPYAYDTRPELRLPTYTVDGRLCSLVIRNGCDRSLSCQYAAALEGIERARDMLKRIPPPLPPGIPGDGPGWNEAFACNGWSTCQQRTWSDNLSRWQGLKNQVEEQCPLVGWVLFCNQALGDDLGTCEVPCEQFPQCESCGIASFDYDPPENCSARPR